MPVAQRRDRSRAGRAVELRYGNFGRVSTDRESAALRRHGERSDRRCGGVPCDRVAVDRRPAHSGMARDQRNSRGVFHPAGGIQRNACCFATTTGGVGGASSRGAASWRVAGGAKAFIRDRKAAIFRAAAGVGSGWGSGTGVCRSALATLCVGWNCAGGGCVVGLGDLAWMARAG